MTLPPVVVVGVDTPIGLTVVRELGRHGVKVHGIARNNRGVGLYSRWLEKGYVQPKQFDGLLNLLDRIAREHGARYFMTVSMNTGIALRQAVDAGRLGSLLPLLAPLAMLELVNDKLAVCRIAAGLGIATPTSWEPGLAELEQGIPAGITFPCILKWRDPDSVGQRLAEHGLPVLKVEYADDAAMLLQALKRYRSFGQFPLVQSYCPGNGLGQMLLMHKGVAVLRFQHRRIAEWPPAGGASTVCESVGPEQHQALMAQSEALLKAIGWEGPAMVEYRYEPETQRAVLMEINGRFWGSLPLAYYAGAPFAWGTYCALGLGSSPAFGPYRAGLQCRYMIPETKRLLTILFRRGDIKDRNVTFSAAAETWKYVSAFFNPRSYYYVFALTDPMPFFADTWFVLRQALQGVARKLLRR
jgi:predicted ATP-grasp superfamily ATP-dependent carboligase